MIPDAAPRPTTSKTADTDGVPAELLPYYEQTLDWSSCSERLRLHHGRGTAGLGGPVEGRHRALADPQSRRGRRRADRVPADQPRRARVERSGADPRLGVVRGERPGAPAVRCDRLRSPRRRRVDRRDVLRRGRHGRVPVRHPRERARDGCLDRRAARTPPAFGEACEANSDGILPYITTDNSARDMDMMRAVLGDEQLNYLGYSYGTFLGATYAKLFPEKVGRLVLDGADRSVDSGTGRRHHAGRSASSRRCARIWPTA